MSTQLTVTPYITADDAPDEHWVQQMRLWRNMLLAQSDWAVLPDAPTDKQAWETYRQALRDFPASWTPGPVADFPDPPA